MIIKLKYEIQEKQIHVRLFMGRDLSQMAMCGSLMFQKAQYDIFTRMLQDGSLLTPGSEIILSDATQDSSSSFPKVKWTPPGGR